MSDEQLPPWLSAALLAVATDPQDADSEGADSGGADRHEDEPAEVLPGDVCIVRPMSAYSSPGRLFVVTAVEDGWCQGMLAGIETELATEVDALLAPGMANLGYEIAVYTRFSGTIWIVQISRRVGAVATEVLDQLLALAWSDEPEGVILPRGIPLQPVGIDPRYPALARMSTELDQLTDHCHRRRSELAAPVFDPALGRPDVLRAVAAEPGSALALAGAEASAEFVDELLAAFPQLSKDEQRALQPLVERALSARPSTSAAGPAEKIVGHHRGRALAQVVSGAATHGPLVTVLSHRRCWHEAPQRARRLSLEYRQAFVVFTPVNDTDLSEMV
ncbi:MAG: hypothetical protein ACRDTC_19635 [Pseudonocardiaceae bacterium]